MNFHKEARKRIIVALDVEDVRKAVKLIENLSPHVGYFKVGLELMHRLIPSFPSVCPNVVSFCQLLALLTKNKLMWDLKFHDIHTTMRKGTNTLISNFKLAFFTVHASAGAAAIKNASQHKGNSKLFSVILLSSLSDNEIKEIYGRPREEAFIRLAKQAIIGGSDGIVCNPNDIPLLNEIKDFPDIVKNLVLVGVGIRPTWAEKNDQLRSVTPGEAVHAGADYMVIGRPLTEPPKAIGGPEDSAQYIVEEIARALEAKEKLRK